MVRAASDEPSNQPSVVGAVDGEVVMMGPGAAGVSFTPGAAEITARRLEKYAAMARMQRRQRRGSADKGD